MAPENTSKSKKTASEPRPKNWNLTIPDLIQEMAEGKRTRVRQQELDWAREYEQSLIPEHYRYPQKGDLYESKIDQEIEFMISWVAPSTSGGKARLFKGEKIWINSKPVEEKPTGIYALPVDYRALEERMVPEKDRNQDKYGGFYFYFDTTSLNEDFNLIKTGFDKKPYE